MWVHRCWRRTEEVKTARKLPGYLSARLLKQQEPQISHPLSNKLHHVKVCTSQKCSIHQSIDVVLLILDKLHFKSSDPIPAAPAHLHPSNRSGAVDRRERLRGARRDGEWRTRLGSGDGKGNLEPKHGPTNWSKNGWFSCWKFCLFFWKEISLLSNSGYCMYH